MRRCFYCVSERVWPILLRVGLIRVVGSGLFIFRGGAEVRVFILILALTLRVVSSLYWWGDFSEEIFLLGELGKRLSSSLRFGMVLFVLSEVIFFSSVFWGFFQYQGVLSNPLGGTWPPLGISVISPFGVPLLNRFILLRSGVTLTICHHSLLLGELAQVSTMLDSTIALGLIFRMFQFLEYFEAGFDISDGIYSRIFFFSTGFHGAHVIVGVSMLTYIYMRLLRLSFRMGCWMGLEMASWYWHFVDVVWLLLFCVVYLN